MTKFTSRTRRRILIIAAVLALILLLFLPLSIPQTITTPAKLLAQKEWIIAKDNNGRLSSMVLDNLSGNRSNYFSTLLERGDAVNVTFSADLGDGRLVNASDTVAVIHSNDLQLRLTQIDGQINIRRRELRLYQSGEKDQLLDEARQQLDAAEIEARLAADLLKRKQALHEGQLISDEELQIAQTRFNLMQKNVDVAQAHLQVLQSGSKMEQIDYIQSQIQALRGESEILHERSGNFSLTAPFTGLVHRVFSGDTLLMIRDHRNYVAVMPVQWNKRTLLQDSVDVTLSIPGSSESYPCKLISVGRDVRSVGSHQMVMAVGKLTDQNGRLASGLMGEARIQYGKISVRTMIWEFIKSMFKL